MNSASMLISKKEIKNLEKNAETIDEEYLELEDCKLDVEELYFEAGKLIITCSVKFNNKQIAFLSMEIVLEPETFAEITKDYIDYVSTVEKLSYSPMKEIFVQSLKKLKGDKNEK